MEHTSFEIAKQLGILEVQGWEDAQKFGGLRAGTKVCKGQSLFPRLDVDKELIKLVEENNAFIEKRGGKVAVSEIEEDLITIEDFDKLDLRTAEVIVAKKHPDADKLLVIELRVGDETRQVVSGISKHYTPEDLIGKKVILVYNLKPVTLRGVESHGMILAAGKGKKLTLATTLEDIVSGAKVK